MQRSRMLMTLFLVLGTLALLSYPWSVGFLQEGSDRLARKIFIQKLFWYVTINGVLFFLAALFAYLNARKIRRDYEERSLQNLADLITSVPSRKKEDSNVD